MRRAMQSISVYSCGPCCIASSYDGRNIMMGGPDGFVKVKSYDRFASLNS
jgi:hypothetical protein